MESNWRWNGWAGSGGDTVAEIAARLLTPINGRDWLWRTDVDPLRLLLVGVLDPSMGLTDYHVLDLAPETGFPYGYEVDQTRIVLT